MAEKKEKLEFLVAHEDCGKYEDMLKQAFDGG